MQPTITANIQYFEVSAAETLWQSLRSLHARRQEGKNSSLKYRLGVNPQGYFSVVSRPRFFSLFHKDDGIITKKSRVFVQIRKQDAAMTKLMRSNRYSEENQAIEGELYHIFRKNRALLAFDNYLPTQSPNACWMNELFHECPQAQEARMNEITVPGTHNSGAYMFDYTNTIQPDNSVAGNIPVGEITEYSGNAIRFDHFITSWSKTQPRTIQQQLNNGIRFLDLRVSYDRHRDRYVLSHTFCCDTLQNVLQQIDSFITENPNEFLMLKVNNDYENRANFNPGSIHPNRIAQMFCGQFPFRLIQVTQDEAPPPFSTLLPTQSRIFLYTNFNDRVVDPLCKPFLWNDGLIRGAWINTSDRDTKLAGLKAQLTQHQPTISSYLNLFFTLTPSKNDIIFSPFKRIFKKDDLKTMCMEVSEQMDEFLAENKQDQFKINILTVDFQEHTDVVSLSKGINYTRFLIDQV